MHEAGHSKLVPWDNPEGWGGEGGFRMGGHMYILGRFHFEAWPKPPQYCKVISLQLK